MCGWLGIQSKGEWKCGQHVDAHRLCGGSAELLAGTWLEITEWLELKGTSKPIQFYPCHGQGCHPPALLPRAPS